MSEIDQAQTKQGFVEKISTREKVCYGFGDLASNLILVLTSTFVAYFYTDALGLNAAIIGTIMMISRFADGVTDVLMGYVVDRTKSKYGKARPWLLWLAIPIAIACVLVFLVPNTGDFGKYVYVTITYNLVTTFFYTMINIPYGAMTSLMSRDQDQRTIINVFRMFMAQCGSLVINACTLPFINKMGGSGDQKSWVIVSAIYAVIAAILFLVCFKNTKERVTVSSEQKETVNFGQSLKLVAKNSQWLLICGVWVSMCLGGGASGAVGTYYAKYVLLNENLSGYLSSISIVPVLIMIPFCVPLSLKFGKRNVALVGTCFSLIGQALMLISPTNFTWLVICAVIKGFGSATLTGTIFAMVADTIEFGEWKTGTRVEGILYSSTTFGAKVGYGFASAAALWALSAAGYNGLAATQTASALASIKAIYLWVPIPFYALMVLFFALYKLDKIYPQVMADLNAREAAKK